MAIKIQCLPLVGWILRFPVSCDLKPSVAESCTTLGLKTPRLEGDASGAPWMKKQRRKKDFFSLDFIGSDLGMRGLNMFKLDYDWVCGMTRALVFNPDTYPEANGEWKGKMPWSDSWLFLQVSSSYTHCFGSRSTFYWKWMDIEDDIPFYEIYIIYT